MPLITRVQACVFITLLYRKKQALVMVPKEPLSFDVSSLVPISRWSSSCPRQCIATVFSRTLYWRREQVVFLAQLYALVVIRQHFAQFKNIQRRHRCVRITIDDGITVQLNSKWLGEINNSSPPPFIHQGPTNAMLCMFSRSVQHTLNTWIGKLWCKFLGMRTSQMK